MGLAFLGSPLNLDVHRPGRLDPDATVTKGGQLGDDNGAFRAMKSGEIARTVLPPIESAAFTTMDADQREPRLTVSAGPSPKRRR
jgi:hypothetical protein